MTRGGVDLDLGFAVTPDNMLDAYAVIAEEATRLRKSLSHFRRALGGGMPRCGGDPVSADASTGFTAAALNLAELCQREVEKLQASADALADAARKYRKSEEEIRTSFDTAKCTYVPSR
jgi:hypothetical protein